MEGYCSEHTVSYLANLESTVFLFNACERLHYSWPFSSSLVRLYNTLVLCDCVIVYFIIIK